MFQFSTPDKAILVTCRAFGTHRDPIIQNRANWLAYRNEARRQEALCEEWRWNKRVQTTRRETSSGDARAREVRKFFCSWSRELREEMSRQSWVETAPSVVRRVTGIPFSNFASLFPMSPSLVCVSAQLSLRDSRSESKRVVYSIETTNRTKPAPKFGANW